jgi:hypothetical protein
LTNIFQASVAVGSVSKAEYINAQVLTAQDGTSLAYGNTASYGKQHPSFVQQAMQTRVGSSGMNKLDTSSDVVYGKVRSEYVCCSPSSNRKGTLWW